MDSIVRGTTTRNEAAGKEAQRQAGSFVLLSNLKKTEQDNTTYRLKRIKNNLVWNSILGLSKTRS